MINICDINMNATILLQFVFMIEKIMIDEKRKTIYDALHKCIWLAY